MRGLAAPVGTVSTGLEPDAKRRRRSRWDDQPAVELSTKGRSSADRGARMLGGQDGGPGIGTSRTGLRDQDTVVPAISTCPAQQGERASWPGHQQGALLGPPLHYPAPMAMPAAASYEGGDGGGGRGGGGGGPRASRWDAQPAVVPCTGGRSYADSGGVARGGQDGGKGLVYSPAGPSVQPAAVPGSLPASPVQQGKGAYWPLLRKVPMAAQPPRYQAPAAVPAVRCEDDGGGGGGGGDG